MAGSKLSLRWGIRESGRAADTEVGAYGNPLLIAVPFLSEIE